MPDRCSRLSGWIAVSLKPTWYDVLLTARTTLTAVKGVRLWFSYRLYNEKQKRINEAETELAFVKKGNWKPCRAPDFVLKAIHANLKT
jgi:acyl-CoA thioester hydrolase